MPMLINITQESYQNKSFYSFVNPLITSVCAYNIAGLPGFLVGGAFAAIDEILIYNDYTDKHYLTTTSFYSSIIYNSKLLSLNSLNPAAYLLSVSLGGLASYFLNDMINFDICVETTVKSINSINKLYSEDDIFSFDRIKYISSEINDIAFELLSSPSQAYEHIEKDFQLIIQNPTYIAIGQIFFNIATTILLRKFSDYLVKDFKPQDNLFETYEWATSGAVTISDKWKLISGIVSKYLRIFAINEVFSSLKDLTGYYINSYKDNLYNSKLSEAVFENNNLIKFATNDENVILLQNIKEDVDSSIYGIDSFNNLFSTVYNSMYGLKLVYNYVPDILFPYLCYKYFSNIISNKIAKNTAEVIDSLEYYNDKKENLMLELILNSKTSEDYRSDESIKNQIQITESEITYYKKYEKFCSLLSNTYKVSFKLIDILIKIFIINDRLIEVTFTDEDSTSAIIKGLPNIAELFLYAENFEQNNDDLLSSLKNIDKFYEILSKPLNENIENLEINDSDILKLAGKNQVFEFSEANLY
ncbi:MAG: hypothetical protein ACK4OM_02405 [Alphaproteobacteria bacterium]